MKKLDAVLKLTRIEHSIMLIIAVVAAEIISGKLPGPWILLLSIITPVFISMGSFAINDYYDIEVDRANRKNRPLVRGDLRPSDAVYITAASMVIGIAASIAINPYCAVIAVVFAALSILYSYRLKELPAVGNAYIAFSMAIPFIFGNYVVSASANYAVLVIFALIFISGMAREIDGSIRDYAGDLKVRSVRTLPKVIGIYRSACLALLLYAVAIAISAYMFVMVPPFMGNAIYAVLMAAADLMLLYSGIIYTIGLKKKYDLVRNVSLGGMALALVCILVSALLA